MMEIQQLNYFIEVAREENISRAAENLHISQSTISKQMKELEEELNVKLFRRKTNGIVLTEEGRRLQSRAKSIIEMVSKTKHEFQSNDLTGGEIFIGCAESDLIKDFTASLKDFKKKYPSTRFHITSGDRHTIIERLDQELLDFGIIVEQPDPIKFDALKFSGKNTYGFLMKQDHPLNKYSVITPTDLIDQDLIIPEYSIPAFSRWCGNAYEQLNLAGTVNLFYNGTLLVRSEIGILLTFEHLVDTTSANSLTFKKLSPNISTDLYLCWKKNHVFNPISSCLLDYLKQAEFIS